eukprot:6620777-Pyramimonas_sp.AAC.1
MEEAVGKVEIRRSQECPRGYTMPPRGIQESPRKFSVAILAQGPAWLKVEKFQPRAFVICI